MAMPKERDKCKNLKDTSEGNISNEDTYTDTDIDTESDTDAEIESVGSNATTDCFESDGECSFYE